MTQRRGLDYGSLRSLAMQEKLTAKAASPVHRSALWLLDGIAARGLWPATRDDLIAHAAASGAPLQLLEELFALPADDRCYDSLATLMLCRAATPVRLKDA